MDTQYVTYEQFGAKGDGVTDDFDAIIACHDYANEHRLPVKACDTATYYIGGKAQHATVKTDVDFGKAKFLIDDRALENRSENVFVIGSDFAPFPVAISSLKKTDTQVDFPHEGRVMVTVTNKNHNIFIREGLNQNNGVPQHELFVVDESGHIESTLNWDYDEITSTVAKRIDDEPITLRGGIFTTIANQEPSFYKYHCRGINVIRSNVTLCDMAHYVDGEGEHGAPYNYFFGFNNTYNATFKNILMTPRFTFYTPSKIPGKDVPMGSYDLGGSDSIKISLIGIRQSKDIMDKRYWGLIGTNYCKEFYLDDCVMSRFDAHQGATDVTIKNSSFGHQSLSLIGHGRCEVENTTAYGPAFVRLRLDYGCHWDGTLTIKNCTWRPSVASSEPVVISAKNQGQHDFGYTAKMPYRIEIDGLKIHDGSDSQAACVYVLPSYAEEANGQAPHAYVPTKKLSFRNIQVESGCDVAPMKNPELYPNLVIE